MKPFRAAIVTRAMVAAFLYDAKGHDQAVELDETPLAALKADQLLWLDLERGDAAGLAACAQALDIDLQCLLPHEGERFDGLIRDAEHFQFALLAAPLHGEKLDRRIDFLVGASWLLTIREGEIPFFADFRDQDRAETEIGNLSPSVLAASLLDWHLESYFAAMGQVEAAIDDLDEATLAERSGRSGLARLAAMRRRVSNLRRLLSAQRGVFHGLSRPDFAHSAGTDALAHFAAVERRYDRAVDQLEVARQAIAGAFDLFSTKTAQETNELVKRLTFVTVLIGFSAAVAGVFGMNFKTGFTESGEHGFYLVLGALVLGSLALTAFARWRKWL